MKTLKQFNEETGLLKAKSKDEQKFIDKHTKEVIPDANGNGDEVFKASLTKKVDRKKERHGYETGEDEKVYEASEPKTARQKDLAAKAPPHDKITHADVLVARDVLKKHPTSGKLVTKEEAENLDELSKDTMLKYLSANKKSDAEAQAKGDYSKSVKRMRGTDVAVRKYTAKPGSKYVRVPATEEVEIEEKTLTKGEMKKREEVVKAIKKGNPKMEKSMAYAIATKTAKRVAEELETAVADLSERHQDLMFKVFSRLNEQNQQKFAAACQTPEGLESMVAFAIENRGE